MFLAGLSLVVMTVIFAWLVYGRYVLNDTPTWVEQVSLLLIMVISFLGASVGVHQHTHLSVVVFRNIVPSWLRTFFVIVTDVVMAIFGTTSTKVKNGTHASLGGVRPLRRYRDARRICAWGRCIFCGLL